MLTGWLTHSCNLLKRAKKQKLLFDGGTGTFTKGLTVSGATSKATAVIDKVSGTATGYLVLKSVTGTFQNDETLTDTGTGAAVANGVCSDYQNSYREYEYYWNTDQSSVPCRFYYAGKDKARIIHETGQLLDLPVKIVLPDTITLAGNQEDWATEYRISTTVSGFAGTYQILSPYVSQGISGIDHYSFILKAVQ